MIKIVSSAPIKPTTLLGQRLSNHILLKPLPAKEPHRLLSGLAHEGGQASDVSRFLYKQKAGRYIWWEAWHWHSLPAVNMHIEGTIKCTLYFFFKLVLSVHESS